MWHEQKIRQQKLVFKLSTLIQIDHTCVNTEDKTRFV